MSRVEIEARSKVMLRRLKALQDRIENPASVLEGIGDVLRKTTVQRFYSQTSPTGRRWKPSKAARKARRLTLVRTGRLRDSIRVAMHGGNVQVGTDVWYARIHQQGGPIDAEYKRKVGSKGIGQSYRLANLRRLPNVTPNLSSAGKLARSAVRKSRRVKARKVRLPARRFLGVSKRDRSRTTELLLKALSEAVE